MDSQPIMSTNTVAMFLIIDSLLEQCEIIKMISITHSSQSK
jgi:hypothetical protein